MAIKCEFGAFLDQAIRDKLVCGISNSKTRKRLLVERDLTLQKAVEISCALEIVDADNQMMDSAVDIKSEDAKVMTFQRKEKPKCYRCASEYHLANSCRFKETICRKCNRVGHLARACRSKSVLKQKSTNNTDQCSETITRQANNIEITHNDSDVDDEIFHIHSIMNTNNPYSIKLAVNSKLITFEIDTGSGVSIISEETYKKHLSKVPLQNSSARIRTYTNEQINVLGKIYVDVKLKREVYKKSKLLVLKGSGVNLVGRDWLSYMDITVNPKRSSRVNKTITLDTETIKDAEDVVSQSILQKLNVALEKNKAIFEDKIGLIKGHKANIHMKDNCEPVFMKSRTVPFALQDAVNTELDKLEKEGIIKSVPFSEWASPIVVIPKSDGSVRICGDFKKNGKPKHRVRSLSDPYE